MLLSLVSLMQCYRWFNSDVGNVPFLYLGREWCRYATVWSDHFPRIVIYLNGSIRPCEISSERLFKFIWLYVCLPLQAGHNTTKVWSNLFIWIGAPGSLGQINIHSTPSMEMPREQIAIQGDECLLIPVRLEFPRFLSKDETIHFHQICLSV